jgi:hypothetical protein
MGRSYNSSAHSHGEWRIHGPCRRGPCPRKRSTPWKRFNRNHRFRGHGPLLQKAWTIPTANGASTVPVGGGPAPESGRRPGSASTGTIAFAAMGRSYNSSAHSHGEWRINGGYTRGPPLVRTPRGQAAAGPRAREAAMGRSYNSSANSHGGWRIHGGYTRGPPLVRAPGGHPQRTVRSERGPSPCSYSTRPSRRGPAGPRGGHRPLLQGGAHRGA